MTLTTSNLACNKAASLQPMRFWTRASSSCITSVSSKKLDERRKAEILKYKGNSARITKKQQYSNMVNGIGPRGNQVWATQTETKTNPNVRELPTAGLNTLLYNNKKPHCSSTTSSDVPGKVKKLCIDENVPLTRFITQRTYLAGGMKTARLA